MITDSQFKSLRDSFLEKSLIGQDVFVNSSPEEVAAFQQFLEASGPFDVVIDGLNVIYRAVRRNKINYDNVRTGFEITFCSLKSVTSSVQIPGRILKAMEY